MALGVPYAPGDCPTVPSIPSFRQSIPIGTLCTQQTYTCYRIQPASKGENQQISKWEHTVNIVNTGVFMLWVQLKEHRLSFKVLPLEIGDRRSPNQNISDIAWYRTDTGGNMRRVWLKEFRKSERMSQLKETITDIVRWVFHWNFHVGSQIHCFQRVQHVKSKRTTFG